MNITDWQAKMIRSSPKSIMKHAHKQLELLGAFNGENGVFKDSVKSHQTIDEKKVRKGNIDLLTGKRKYTKKHLKLDGVLASSEFNKGFKTLGRIHMLNFLFSRIQRKKEAQEAKRSSNNGIAFSCSSQIYVQEADSKDRKRRHVTFFILQLSSKFE